MSRVINTHNELVRRCVQHAQLVCKEPSELLEQLDADGISPGNRRSKPREHRPSVFSVFRNTPVIVGGVKTADKENIRRYVQLILGFANGMAMWMAISKRYMA